MDRFCTFIIIIKGGKHSKTVRDNAGKDHDHVESPKPLNVGIAILQFYHPIHHL